MNRADRRRLSHFLGLHVETTVLRCSGCGMQAVHVEVWEHDDDQAHGLPLDLARCDCGGFLFPLPHPIGGDARE